MLKVPNKENLSVVLERREKLAAERKLKMEQEEEERRQREAEEENKLVE